MQSEAYTNEANELDIIDIQAIDTIDFSNCHLVVKYWLAFKPDLIEAISNEYESQLRFNGDNNE